MNKTKKKKTDSITTYEMFMAKYFPKSVAEEQQEASLETEDDYSFGVMLAEKSIQKQAQKIRKEK